MADNVIINPGVGGAVISTEDIGGGIELPRSKVVIGSHGVDGGNVHSGNPLPVTGTIALSGSTFTIAGTTTVTPASGATFTCAVTNTPTVTIGNPSFTLAASSVTVPTTVQNSPTVTVGNAPSVTIANTTLAVRPTDGSNAISKTYDLDSSGSTHEYGLGVQLRTRGNGGSVEAGTSSSPIRTDPTGTSTQPVSGTVTCVGSGTSTIAGTVTVASITSSSGLALDNTLTGGSAKTRIVDGTNSVTLLNSNPTGSEYAVPVRNIPSGTQPVSGTVTAVAGSGTFTCAVNNAPTVTIGNAPSVTVANNPTVTISNATLNTRATDGTNPISKTFDLDTSGSTHEFQTGVILRTSASGGSAEAGTTAHPLIVQPSGSGTQPVSGTVAVSSVPSVTIASGTVAVSSLPSVTIAGTVTTSPTGTQLVRPSDGTHSLSSLVDMDSGSGTDYVLPVVLRTEASGGGVDFGTASNPIVVSTSGSVTLASTTIAATESGVWTVTSVPSGTQAVSGSVAVSSVPSITIASGTVAATQSGSFNVGQAGTWVNRLTDGTNTCAVTSGSALSVDCGSTTVTATGTVTSKDYQPAATTGTITASSGSTVATVTNASGALVSVNGTYAGVSFVFEASDDSGTTYYAVNGVRLDDSISEAGATTLTNTSRAWKVYAPGATNIRVRSTAYTSGTANIRLSPHGAMGDADVIATIPGTVTASISNAPTVTVANPSFTLAASSITLPTTISGTVATTIQNSPSVTCLPNGTYTCSISNNPTVTVANTLTSKLADSAGSVVSALKDLDTSGSTHDLCVPVSLRTSASGGSLPFGTASNPVAVTGTLSVTGTTTISGNVGQGTAAAAGGSWPVQFTDGTHLITAGDNSNNAVRVNVVSGPGGGTSNNDKGTFSIGSTSFTPVGGVFDDGTTTLTTDQTAAARCTPQRALHINLRNQAGTEVGTSTTPMQITGTVSSTGTVTAVGSGTAGTPATGVLTVQGISSGTAQPVSGTVSIGNSPTVTANAGSGTFSTALVSGLPDVTATGSLTAVSQTVQLGIAGFPGAGVQLGAGGFVATLLTEASQDGGSTWFVVYAWRSTNGASSYTLTSSGNYGLYLPAGCSHVRVRCSAYTSGTVSVTIRASCTYQASTPSECVSGNGVGARGMLIGGQDGSGYFNFATAITAAPAGTEAGLIVRNIPNGTQTIIGSNGALALDASVTGLQVAQNSTTSGQSGGLMQGAVTTSAPSYTTAKTDPLSLDTSGNLRVINQPSGTYTVAYGSGTFPVSGTVTSVGSGTYTVGGDVASAASDSGNPVKIGAKAINAEATAVTNAQRVNLVSDLVGKQIVLPYANPENFLNGTGNATGTGDTAVIASQGGSLRIYVTTLIVNNTSATNTYVNIKDGSTTKLVVPAPANGGSVIPLPVPLRLTAATALNFASGAGVTTMYVSALAYSGV